MLSIFSLKNWLLLYEVECDRLKFEIGLGMTSKSIPGGALGSAQFSPSDKLDHTETVELGVPAT